MKIYLSEAMYRMMWDYFFPEEDDSQRRQVINAILFPSLLWSLVSLFLIYVSFLLGEKEVWRVSTSTGPRRTRRLSSGVDAVTSSSYSVREQDIAGKTGTTVHASTNVSTWQGVHADNSQVSQLQQSKY